MPHPHPATPSLLYLAPSPSLSTLAFEPAVQVKRVGAESIFYLMCNLCQTGVCLGTDINAAWRFPLHTASYHPQKPCLQLLLKKSWAKCIFLV